MFDQDEEEFKDRELTPEPLRVEGFEEFAGEAPQELQTEDGRAWYVVHCYSGYENKVRHNLEQRIETSRIVAMSFCEPRSW